MAKKTEQLELAQAQQQGFYTIGEASKLSGLSAKMIRYYEDNQLITPSTRTLANYRVYLERDIHLLGFIKSARDLGFTIKQISQLVNLWQDKERSSADVKNLALAHIAEMDERIQLLQSMRNQLSDLAELCHGDNKPECPILRGIEQRSCR